MMDGYGCDIWLLSRQSRVYTICPGLSSELQTWYAYARGPARVCSHARKDVLSCVLGALTDTVHCARADSDIENNRKILSEKSEETQQDKNT